MDFLPDSGEDCRSEFRSEDDKSDPSQPYAGLKAKVGLAAMKGDKRWPNWPSSSMSNGDAEPLVVHPPSGARLRDEARIRPDSTDAEGQDVQRRRGRHCASAAG